MAERPGEQPEESDGAPEPLTPDEAKDALRAFLQGIPQVVREVPSIDQIRRQDYLQNLRLKRMYALGLLGILFLQLVFANVGFFLYGWLGVDWKVTPSVMNVWLSATVVEVVGVVFVVTRHLFPSREVEGP